jgi:exopolyphosphatase/guanosine-5'-triphosphate,3'-diphosphate pyrophosphatase
MRVATVDIGTNTILLLVAERAGDGRLCAVEEHATITRLGEGVDKTRQLSAAALGRTRACLEAYARVVERLGAERVAVVGTSAMRDASRADVVLSMVRTLFGVDARVIQGREEARLTFRGALSGLSLHERETAAIFDVGGGSTEIVIGRLEADGLHLEFAQSFDVGSVRLTERLVLHDPPTHRETRAVLDAARTAFEGVPLLPATSPMPVGIAGTVTTLAAVSMGLASFDASAVHGRVMPTDEVRRVVGELASVTLDERKRRPGLDPLRADVIVAGGHVVLALLEHWWASEFRVSDRGVRWGLAEELCA